MDYNLLITMLAITGTYLAGLMATTLVTLQSIRQKKAELVDCIMFNDRRKPLKRLTKRKYWVRPGRTDQWFKNMMEGRCAEEEWMENFRMRRDSFEKLCDKLRAQLQRQTTVLRKPLSVEKQVGIFLYYIADEGRLRKSANAFGIAKSTASKVVRRVAQIVSTTMADMIKLPATEDEVKHLASRYFEAHGFPQCIGAVDGTHVAILKPADQPTAYLNKSNIHSLNIQALCDYRYCFLDVVIKWPGCVHDARIFSNSRLNAQLKDGTIPRCPSKIVDDEPEVPICILADPAYPLLPSVMKEFTGGGKTVAEQFYGYRLSSARMTIECAFGRLKGRFGCLRRNMDINLRDLPAVIHSCFILHNYCEVENNPVPPALVEEAERYDRLFQPPRDSNPNESHSNNVEGKRIRNIFVKYFE